MRCVFAGIFGCKYLTEADQAARKPEAEHKRLHLENARLERRAAELQDLLARRASLVAEPPADDKAANRKAEAEHERLRLENARLERCAAALREKLSRSEASAKPDVGFKGLAVSLIQFRDQLSYFADECAKEDNPIAVKLLANLYKETGRFMTANGVEPIEETGVFDATRQRITSTIPTAIRALDNTVAETFRPGYRIGGELYRPQEAVVYVYTEARS